MERLRQWGGGVLRGVGTWARPLTNRMIRIMRASKKLADGRGSVPVCYRMMDPSSNQRHRCLGKRHGVHNDIAASLLNKKKSGMSGWGDSGISEPLTLTDTFTMRLNNSARGN